jgi:hypothetical protein
MKASDFDLSKDLKFDLTSGVTSFKSSRLVIMDAGAMGLLRQKLLDTLGEDKARELLLTFGYQNGFSDFMQMKLAYRFDSELDLLASGPAIHTWEGIVHATPIEARVSRQEGDFYFPCVWKNSYEAEQHLCFNQTAKQPVCWTLMGYASGWCTAFMGKRMLAIETKCVGMGDPHCEVMIQPEPVWGKEAQAYKDAYREFAV